MRRHGEGEEGEEVRNVQYLGYDVLRAVRQNLQVEPDDASQDSRIAEMDADELGMSGLPPHCGAGALPNPEPVTVYTCHCGGEFRWWQDRVSCVVCEITLCDACPKTLCESCYENICAEHTREVDGLALCPPCAGRHEEDLIGK